MTAERRHAFDLDAIGRGLPVADSRAQLAAAIGSGAAVVSAPPGTGKTTFVPPLVASLVTGRVVVTQPRRVAVRAAARRLAELDGSRLGEAVGFTVRGERAVSAATRVEVVTPGVLLRRLLDDPGLDGVGAVVLDEVHERSLDGDLLLGLLAEVRALRDDLALIAMSATLETETFAPIVGGAAAAAVVDVPSALHPLKIRYAPAAAPRVDQRGTTREFLDHLARETARAHAASAHDALVFVPSARDVDDLVTRLGPLAPDAEVLPLHGRLSSAAQDRATAGRRDGDARRIVVSTALAESSLTVPGVRLVVDAGLSREVRRDRARDMTGLVTVSASRASADQRAGRAARQGPGTVVRAYSEADYAAFRRAAEPEIASADLVDAMLLLAAWGTPGGSALPLPTAPPAKASERAQAALRAMGLVDAGGRITDEGARVARLPIGAREARALRSAAAAGIPRAATAEIVAALAGDHRAPDADLDALLRELRRGSAPGASRWRSEARRLERLAPSDRPEPVHAPQHAAGVVAALARPEWLAHRTAAGARTYLLASGTRAALPERSPLAQSEWIAVAALQRQDGRAADGTGAVIRLAAAIDADDALEAASALVSEERASELTGGRVRVRLERRLGAIVLSSTPAAPEPGDAARGFEAAVRADGLGALEWSDAAIALRARLGLLRRAIGEPWPDVSDRALLEDLDAWLGPELARLRPGAAMADIDLVAALRTLLPWPAAARLDELAPEQFAVPSGSRVRIAYPDPSDEAPPVVAVKLQEVFGLADTPRLADGRVPVLFHLLSPARRPVAVTDDLRSFWDGPYRDVRAELRGRYPKHPWPEDPWTAPATARTTRALRRD